MGSCPTVTSEAVFILDKSRELIQLPSLFRKSQPSGSRSPNVRPSWLSISSPAMTPPPLESMIFGVPAYTTRLVPPLFLRTEWPFRSMVYAWSVFAEIL